MKFISVGAIATIIQYAIFILLIEFFYVEAVMASAFGYGLSSILNYLLNYHFTFSSNAKHSVAALKFTIVVIVGLSLNSLIMYILVNLFSCHYLLAQIITTGVVLIFNFVVHKYWTYKTKQGIHNAG
jgi:putative flippase GtrA